MKIGLISDIHADADGLRIALDRLGQLGADKILCAGDLVERGTGGDAVIDILRAANIPTIKGNHEFSILAKHRRRAESGSGGLGFRELTAESLSYIESLPERLKLSFGECSLLLAHGTPWDDFTFAFPDSAPMLFKRIAYMAKSQIVVLGHTHEPMCVHVGATRVLNPGSIHL